LHFCVFIGMSSFDYLGDSLPFYKLSQEDFVHTLSLPDTGTYCNSKPNYNCLSQSMGKILKIDIIKEAEYNYYTTEQLNSLAQRNRKNTILKIFHCNIRSLNANHTKLLEMLECCKFKFHVIILTEIWSTNIDFYSNLLDNYLFYYQIPLKSDVGGVGMYFKKSLYPIVKHDISLKSLNFETLWVELSVDKVKYLVGGYYRHPNTSVLDFKDSLMGTLSKFRKNKRCILAGDINIDANMYKCVTLTSDFFDELISFGYIPYAFLSSRITKTSKTAIDHIYTNCRSVPGLSLKCGLLTADISDHMCNFLFVLSPVIKLSKERPFIRMHTAKNLDRYLLDLSIYNWDELFCLNDVNDAFDLFTTTLTSIYNKNFPLVMASKKYVKNKSWITLGLRTSILKKQKLYKKWIKSGLQKDYQAYRLYSNLLRKLLRRAEASYYCNVLDPRYNSIKQIWHTLNKTFNPNKKQSHLTVKKLTLDDDTVLDKEVSIAESFNNYFCNIGSDLASKLPNVDNDKFKRYLPPSLSNSFVCNEITLAELDNVISTLKNKKSCGPDQFSSFIIKSSKQFILNPLLYIFNLSFSKGVFPDKLKSARVIPLYKKGSMDRMCNYRPLSLSSVFSKLIERLMYNRLLAFLKKFNILYDYQFGFRQGYSTSLALFEVIEMINNELGAKNNVMGIFMDLQKAFDTVNFDILLYKLSHYGVRGHVLNWFQSFLCNRDIFTVVGKINSSKSTVKCGVPQGSVLGPLLFLIYINDVSAASSSSRIRLFADDSNVFIVNKDVHELFKTANIAINEINEWFVCNKLSINFDKTNYMIFKPNVCLNDVIKKCNLSLSVNNVIINRTVLTKYLGVWIDDLLSWKSHIDNTVKKNANFISMIYNKRYLIPYDCRKNLYFSLIYSRIIYGIEVFGSAGKSIILPLHISCNRVLRALQNKPRRYPVSLLYSNFNSLSIQNLYKFFLLLLVYKLHSVKYSIPPVICSMFVSNANVHSHNTRSRSFLHLNHNISTSSGSIVFYASTLWNHIPQQLKIARSITLFKKELKLFLKAES